MIEAKKQIDVTRLRTIFEADPAKKRDVCKALGFDRQTISKILTGRRNIEAGEFLTIAEICEIQPAELAT